MPLFEYTSNNYIFLELEKNGFITPDEKVEELIKNLTKLKYLFALKLLFENQLNQFSPEVLRNSLVVFADPAPFDYYEKQSVARLELHIRTLVAILEQICVTPMRLSKELRDKVYNSLAKFAEIHRKTTQVMQQGIYNTYKSSFSQFSILQQDDKDDENFINKRNYNIDFLLIHLRDTLHSLRDDETWFREIIRRIKELLKAALNITPGVLPTVTPGVSIPNDNCSILSLLVQLRKGLSFKYPVASYYVDWRIMLIIKHNLFNWSGSVSRKFQEMVLMEYFWSYLEKEWIDIADKSILDSQSKFDEASNKLSKVLRNTGSFINDLAGNEPLVLPHTLWFGILDLAQNLIQNSTRESTHGLCYYLAIESLNRAPSSFIQFKAIEILFYLHKINEQMFSIIEIDFDQYIQNLLNSNVEMETLKGKGKVVGKKSQNTHSTKKRMSKSDNILEIIANEMTCPIDHEPKDQLCILKCHHLLSYDNFKRLKQKICPECREKIEDNDIRYVPQNVIYKYLYSQFYEAGHILPLDNSENNHYDSDSDDSEVNLMLTKKKKILKTVKLNPSISLQSIFQIGKKQHPIYLSAIKELEEKNYKAAKQLCKEFLEIFPESYSMRCILAYTYRCLVDYGQARLYLKEAIELKEKKPIAWYISGEIHFRQGNCYDAVRDLKSSVNSKAKINNIYIILGISYYSNNYYLNALKNFKIALRNNPNNYLCLKYCAYIYDKERRYSDTLETLDKLLSINEKDSLILCYYGEILSKMEKHEDAIVYFTKANDIDPENVHNLNMRAVAYYILQEYNKALLDLNKVIRLDVKNSLAHFHKGLTYYRLEDIKSSLMAFKRCIRLNPRKISDQHIIKCIIDIESKKYEDAKLDLNKLFELNVDISFVYLLKKYSEFWSHLCKFYGVEDEATYLDVTNKFNIYMFKEYNVYFISNCNNCINNYHFQESDLNSSSGLIFSFEDNNLCSFRIYLDKTSSLIISRYYNIVWKINVKEINSLNVFVKFKFELRGWSSELLEEREYILKYEDILELKGLGWVEYMSFFSINLCHESKWIQFSVEIEKNSIDMSNFILTDDVVHFRCPRLFLAVPDTSAHCPYSFVT
ncbi:hypothetical protein RclHR1_01660003 [Rhizophagus clarus]|uniref:Uncharacterized protein n=1 Tax=Rhizophagus clarus TaxID=94130 RepID=A0A2Z6QX00_9GLOM|nr:hypothetical protein RclHR1_01660003 [Rhizophagus clarus]